MAAACSLLVPSELESIRCSDEGAIGPPACRPAEVCAKGSCTSCASFEACSDGIDNDCDGRTDEDCATDAGREAAPAMDGAIASTLGEPCASDADCDAGQFCPDPSALGVSGSRFCTTGCCKSADCGQSAAICWPAPGGAALCVPAARVSRPPPGPVRTGYACQSDGECRSAWCGTDEGVCLDTCCRNSDCPGPSAPDCTLRDWLGLEGRVFACGRSPGSRAYQDSCFGGPSSCRSGLCVATVVPFCTQSCCTTSDCGGTLECGYVDSAGTLTRVCALSGVEGTLDIGEVCDSDSDCRSAWCLAVSTGGSLCTDACCFDRDCGDSSRFGCRLGERDGNWVLRCEPL